jgi:Rps23 Pro-64 3,4-dihydroxylase Tpa1-like proline 4-hydroxylase
MNLQTQQIRQSLLETKATQLEETETVIPSPHFYFDNFLSMAENQQLLDYAICHQAHYIPAPTSTADPSKRKALLLTPPQHFSDLILNRIEDIWADALAVLKVRSFSASRISVQLIAQNHGDYVKRHCDRNSVVPDRKLTFVYYFHQEPQSFSGGEFALYDSQIKDGELVSAKTHHVIQPRNNRILLFVSRNFHEVLPIACPSQFFEHSRFAFSGWFHQTELTLNY